MKPMRLTLLATSAFFLLHCEFILGQVNFPPRMVKTAPKEALFQYLEATKLDCKAEGYPEPTYRWERNFKEFSYRRNDGRYTKWPNEGTLVFALPGQDDDGMYQCIATNALGSAYSPIVNMRRADLKDFLPTPVRIVDVSPGQYIMLKCTVPTSFPPPIVAWSMYDASSKQLYTIKETRRRAVDVDGNLHISTITEEDNGLFICTANNIYLRLMKQGERHQLRVKSGAPIESPCFVAARSPETQIAIINSTNIYLKCIIACSPAPQYTWTKVGKPDDYIQNSPFLRIVNGGTELEIIVKSTDAAGAYRCTGRNERSSKYPIIQYTVYVHSLPVFTIQPEDYTVEEFGSHVFRCEADGIPKPTIKWTVNGGEPNKYMDGVRKRIEGNVIYLTNLTIQDAAVFQCNASNSHGYAFTNAFLNVLRDRPAFVLPPQQNLIMATGQSVDFHCQTFSAPKAVVTWTKDGRTINGGRYIMLDNGDLRIENINPQDAGNYSCTARNKFGENSATGSLKVRQRTRIHIKPLDTRVYENKDVKFVCTAETDPEEKLQVNWYKDQNPLNTTTNPRVQVNIQDNSLIISGAMPRDTGMYTCNATNGIDYAVHMVSLVVQGRPDRPEDVTLDCVEQITQKLAVLNWRPGADNYAPIIGYIIEYSTQYEYDTWYLAELDDYNNVNDNAARAKLRPHIQYSFRVRTKNRVGISEPSIPTSVTCQIPPQIPSDNPKELYVYGTKTRNLVVQWTTMPYILQNGPNLGYELNIRCLDCSSTPNNKDNVTSVAEWSNDRISFDFLVFDKAQYLIEEFRTYQVSIRSKNDMGQSSAQPVVTEGFSGGDVPTVAPTEVAIVNMTASHAVVTWRALQQSDLRNVRGFFQGYRVEWCFASLTDGDCFLNRRYKDVILRNFTAPIRFGRRRRRSIEIPSPSYHVRKRSLDMSDRLEQTKYTLSEEYLERSRRSYGLSPAVSTEIFFTRNNRVRRDIPWGDMMSLSLDNLPGNAKIRVFVRVLNTLFAGPPSTPITITTSMDAPDPVSSFKLANIGVNHVEVTWTQPANTNGQLNGYQIGVQQLHNLELGFLTRYPPINDPNINTQIVAGLKPRTPYRVYIWSFNDYGQSMDNFIDVETSPSNLAPSPPTFWVEPIGKSGFNISFAPSRTGIPGSVFFAQYRLVSVNRWEETRPEYQKRWINISGLVEDQWYEVRMVATNGASMTSTSKSSLVRSNGDLDRNNHLKGAAATWFILIVLILIGLVCLAVGMVILRRKRQEAIFGAKQLLVNEDTRSGDPSTFGYGQPGQMIPPSPPQEFADGQGSVAYEDDSTFSPPASQQGKLLPQSPPAGPEGEYEYQDDYTPRAMSPEDDYSERQGLMSPGQHSNSLPSPPSGPRPSRPGGYMSPKNYPQEGSGATFI